MKNLLTIFVLSSIIMLSCKQNKESYQYSAANIELSSDSLGLQIANPVIYDIIVKNPDPEDTWAEEKLENLNREELVDIIFEAVYTGRIKAWEYHSGEEMSLKDVKRLEKREDFDRSLIAKIQFEEEWYLDPVNFSMTKRIKSLLLAYEVMDQFGNVAGYRAAFLVKLN